jgi:Trk K+ transport system NAD-binding subunit
MKYLPSQLLYFLQQKTIKSNIRNLYKFLIVLSITVILYTVLFHFIMEYEGRQYSWITGFYWTLTVMSTLGFGDITFTSDLGRAFSMIVLFSGILFLLIMLPFTFIRFFYAPWLESQAQIRTPRELPATAHNHIIITSFEPISASLIKKLKQYDYEYVIAVHDMQRATELVDMNYRIVVGNLDKPETYKNLRIEKAALVVVNNNDMLNTNIVATIREVSESVPVVTSADVYDSIDILELAGATHVFQFASMLGVTMAQHAIGISAQTSMATGVGRVHIANAYAAHTPFEGKKLIESELREITGVNVVGVWQRGTFEIPRPQTVIHPTSVLLLAGSEDHFKKYDAFVDSSRAFAAPVVILGGGRVGQAAARTLADHGIEYQIVEKDKNLIEDDQKYILGDAADIHVLERAGLAEKSPSVLITTHDDDINIYLTIYCRQLRPDIQIISRATLERNISKLYAVGADIVMSYASMGANRILNILKQDEILMLAEGLHVFKVSVAPSLIDKTISESQIRKKTGCNVIAVDSGDTFIINPDPSVRLRKNDELILIGTIEIEKKFLNLFS